MQMIRHGLALTLLSLAGCAGENEAAPNMVVTDSAGVRIVQNTSIDPVASTWRISWEPLFRVGWKEGGPEFGSISSGEILNEGGVVIVDRQRSELVELTAEGQVLRVMGRQGEGPGEFTGLRSVVAVGDSILAHDVRQQKVTIFVGGQYSTEHRWSRTGPFMFELVGKFSDGGLHFAAFAETSSLGSAGGWVEAPVLKTDRNFSATDTIALLPYINADESDNPFRYRGWHMHGDGDAAYARSDLGEVQWFDADGALRQIARWDTERVELTEDVWEEFEQGFRKFVKGRPGSEKWLDELKAGASGPLPLFGTALGDAEGNVWLGEYTFFDNRPGRFFVVRADGEAVGWVELPRPMRVLRISGDKILAVERNELDVEAVAVYPIGKD